MKESITLEDK